MAQEWKSWSNVDNLFPSCRPQSTELSHSSNSPFIRFANQLLFQSSPNKCSTLQSSKSWSVYLLIFKVNQDNLDDVILLASQGVSCTEVQEGLIVRRGLLNWPHSKLGQHCAVRCLILTRGYNRSRACLALAQSTHLRLIQGKTIVRTYTTTAQEPSIFNDKKHRQCVLLIYSV